MKQRIDRLPFGSDERERREEIFKSIIRDTVLAEIASFINSDDDVSFDVDASHNFRYSTGQGGSSEGIIRMIENAVYNDLRFMNEDDPLFPVYEGMTVAILKNFFTEGEKVRDFRSDILPDGGVNMPALMARNWHNSGRLLNIPIIALDPELLNETRSLLGGTSPSAVPLATFRTARRAEWENRTSFGFTFDQTWEDLGIARSQVDDIPSFMLKSDPQEFVLDFLQRHAKDQDSLQRMLGGDFSDVINDIGQEEFFAIAPILAVVLDAQHNRLISNREETLDRLDLSTVRS